MLYLKIQLLATNLPNTAVKQIYKNICSYSILFILILSSLLQSRIAYASDNYSNTLEDELLMKHKSNCRPDVIEHHGEKISFNDLDLSYGETHSFKSSITGHQIQYYRFYAKKGDRLVTFFHGRPAELHIVSCSFSSYLDNNGEPYLLPSNRRYIIFVSMARAWSARNTHVDYVLKLQLQPPQKK